MEQSISLISFLLLIVTVCVVTSFIGVLGYYSWGKEKESLLKASFLQTGMAFFLFLFLAIFGTLFFQLLFEYLLLYGDIQLEHLPLRLLSGMASIGMTAVVLCFYGKRTIFKKTPLFNVRAFLQGMMTWMIAYPQMVILSIILHFVTTEILGLTPKEQSPVLELRQAKAYPVLFLGWIFTLSILVPLCEEILFRGFLQSSLKKIVSKTFAIGISSLIFSLFHFSKSQGAGNIVIIPSLFFLSLYLGFVYEKWGSISASFGLHATFNFASSLMINDQACSLSFNS